MINFNKGFEDGIRVDFIFFSIVELIFLIVLYVTGFFTETPLYLLIILMIVLLFANYLLAQNINGIKYLKKQILNFQDYNYPELMKEINATYKKNEAIRVDYFKLKNQVLDLKEHVKYLNTSNQTLQKKIYELQSEMSDMEYNYFNDNIYYEVLIKLSERIKKLERERARVYIDNHEIKKLIKQNPNKVSDLHTILSSEDMINLYGKAFIDVLTNHSLNEETNIDMYIETILKEQINKYKEWKKNLIY